MNGRGDHSGGVGALALVLHAHMPYVVGFGTWPFGEEWLWEAIASVYLPLFETIDGFPVTLGLTPVLCDQLELVENGDGPERQRLVRFVEETRIGLVGSDRRSLRERGEGALAEALASQEGQYRRAASALAAGWRPLARARALRGVEVLASAATHPVLPIVATDAARRFQVATGIASHRRRFGGFGGGIWLPECAWRPGLEDALARCGVRYFCVDRTRAVASGGAEHLEPLALPGGLVAVPIDWELVRLVWDERSGYPTRAPYRDYYRGTEHHFNPWANDGLPYRPGRALAQAESDARDFVARVASRLRDYQRATGRCGVVCCALDAELLGHWWAEGVEWLRSVLRLAPTVGIELVTLGEAASRARREVAGLEEASWGSGKDLSTWDCAAADEIVAAARVAELRLLAAARRAVRAGCGDAPALARAARELLALQASDWAFMATKRTAGPYPLERVRAHRREFDAALAALEHCRPVERPTVGNLAPDLAVEHLFAP